MTKIKHFILALAVLAGMGGALAFSPKKCPNCWYGPTYYVAGYDGTGNPIFRPAGYRGYDYFCAYTYGVCTYYPTYDPITGNWGYQPCEYGYYIGTASWGSYH